MDWEQQWLNITAFDSQKPFLHILEQLYHFPELHVMDGKLTLKCCIALTNIAEIPLLQKNSIKMGYLQYRYNK